MVRLRREMEGLTPDPERTPPVYLSDVDLRPLIDDPTLDALDAFEWEHGGRVMTLGVEPRVITSLLERAGHVSVVEPDDQVRQAIAAELGSKLDPTRLTFHSKPYSEISFESNSFDLIVVFDEFNRYADASNIARKCGRELRISGKLFSRVTLLPSNGKAGWGDRNNPWALDLTALEEGMKGGLAIDEIHRVRIVSPTILDLITRLPPGMRKKVMKMMPTVKRVEARLDERARSAHTTVAVLIGSKTLGLGKVFHTPK
jgi:hypothetical protein